MQRGNHCAPGVLFSPCSVEQINMILSLLFIRQFRHGTPLINSRENSVDPDQLASQKPADLDPRCFPKRNN